jgi:hypothetical protein
MRVVIFWQKKKMTRMTNPFKMKGAIISPVQIL